MRTDLYKINYCQLSLALIATGAVSLRASPDFSSSAHFVGTVSAPPPYEGWHDVAYPYIATMPGYVQVAQDWASGWGAANLHAQVDYAEAAVQASDPNNANLDFSTFARIHDVPGGQFAFAQAYVDAGYFHVAPGGFFSVSGILEYGYSQRPTSMGGMAAWCGTGLKALWSVRDTSGNWVYQGEILLAYDEFSLNPSSSISLSGTVPIAMNYVDPGFVPPVDPNSDNRVELFGMVFVSSTAEGEGITVVPEPNTYLAGLSALGILRLFGWRHRK